MHIDEVIRPTVGASAKRSGARITTSRPSPIMSFKKIPRILVGADLWCTPAIYRPLLAVPVPDSFVKIHYRPLPDVPLVRLFCQNPLSTTKRGEGRNYREQKRTRRCCFAR